MASLRSGRPTRREFAPRRSAPAPRLLRRCQAKRRFDEEDVNAKGSVCRQRTESRVISGTPAHFSGTTTPVVGQVAGCNGSSGPMPARSSMIMGMKASAVWKPRALVRRRPMAALLDSAMPFVSRHSMVASIEAR